MQKVIITGAAGFIGYYLAKSLAESGVEIYALDRPQMQERIYSHERVHYVAADIADLATCIEELDGVKADVLYHLAWVGVTSDLKNDIGVQIRNIEYNLNALKLCETIGCKHVVIPGSASEYAYCGETITDNNLPSPGDAYAACKAATRITCEFYAKQNKLKLNWLIISSIYGPGRNDNNIITYSIKTLLKGERPSYSKLEQQWDYIYIGDLIEALRLVGEYGKEGEAYPVGSGNAQPLRSYIKQIHSIIDPSLPLGIGDLPYKKAGIQDNSVLDISKLTADTGFVPKVSFEEGIKKTINYFRSLEESNA